MTEAGPGALGVDALGRLAVLGDPLRRSLYGFVAERPEPVSRDEVAEAAGIGRTLAAYHLDKLAEAGLLTADYRRAEGRRGPGAGRPPKLYTKADGEIAISVPSRDYELLARLLASAIEHDTAGTTRAAVHEAARAAGHTAGREAGDTTEALRRGGYQPRVNDDGTIELGNCPFHRIAATQPELVCGLNLRLIEGILAGTGESAARASLDPRPGRCCITIADPPRGPHRRARRRRRTE